MPDASAHRPQRFPRDPVKVYDLGFNRGSEIGFNDCRHAALTFLQQKYIDDPERPDRGTLEAEAILKLAKELSLFLAEQQSK